MTYEVSVVTGAIDGFAFPHGYSLHATGEGNCKSLKCDLELLSSTHWWEGHSFEGSSNHSVPSGRLSGGD